MTDKIDAILAEASIDAPASEPAQPQADAPKATDDNQEAQQPDANEAEGGEGEQGEPKAELTPEQKHQKELKKLQNAIAYRDKKTWKLQNQLEQERAEIARLKAMQQPAAPKESDFEGRTYDELLEAKANHAADKRFQENQLKASEERAAKLEQEYAQERTKTLSASAAEAKKAIPDFNQVMSEHAAMIDNLPPAIASAIIESDNAPQALYAIIKDGAFDEFASLSPYRAAAMLARYEDKASQLTKPKSTVTKAPEPMASAKGSGSGGKSLDRMSPDELRTWLAAG